MIWVEGNRNLKFQALKFHEFHEISTPFRPRGSRPLKNIVKAWDAALKEAFNGLEFTHVRGTKGAMGPAGYWTTELQTKA